MINNIDLVNLKRKIKEIVINTEELNNLLSQILVIDDKTFGQEQFDYIKKLENEILVEYNNNVVKPLKKNKKL